MIAMNIGCYKCKHNKPDWACATDYCAKDHDGRLFSLERVYEEPCEDFELKEEA